MTKYLLWPIAALCLFLISSTPGKKSPLDKFSPPGTVRIGEKLWFDETEITNFSWLEYLYHIKQNHGKDSPLYTDALPDTTVWEAIPGAESKKTAYLRHPVYRDYPVVGITYEQAQAYCEWRTDRVREFMEIIKTKKPDYYIPKSFQYRLPSEKEWESMAKLGYSKKVARKREKALAENEPLLNYRTAAHEKRLNGDEGGSAELMAPVYSYFGNEHGIYNLQGNAAEMVLEKGTAKGGSFFHPAEACESSSSQQFYKKSEVWLSFRCVCEVTEE